MCDSFNWVPPVIAFAPTRVIWISASNNLILLTELFGWFYLRLILYKRGVEEVLN